MRTIKSYVLRAGRMSPRQQQGLTEYLPRYELAESEQAWDWQTVFGREADTIVEIGFGMGASLLTMAINRPELNFLGIEVHRAGLGSLAADIHDHQLLNLKLAGRDAVQVFKNQIPDQSLAGIQIYFPDPWPKKRHHKRRLVQPALIELLSSKLKPGAYLHCATDWQDYAEQMLSVLSAASQLKNSQAAGGYSPRPDWRPLTKFEQRGNQLGHGVWDLIFEKI